jgi:hypothetical protein
MQKCLFLILLVVSSYTAFSQAYFQQQVDYKMVVTLDTTDQTVKVSGQMEYHNNSDTALDYLLIHVWWNAFSDKQSAFALQQYKTRDLTFHFAKVEEMGGYDTLSFNYGAQALAFDNYQDAEMTYPDILQLNLEEPIAAQTSSIIGFSYVLDIPKNFSRPGYDGQLYRMTQWYPKPAVFDREGWHPMPYLSYGEYFAEYGDYEVELRLPSSHQVGCTGSFSSQKTTSGGQLVTARNVLDFAWFSSEHFDTYSRKINLEGNLITLNLLTNNTTDTKTLLDYVERGLTFYSNEVGLYPYPQYTLVYDEGNDRGGMEYPMISMVDMSGLGQNLDNLIAHEIGHNWFQSILGSNERKYPWMDEGLNSFYERAYNDAYYPKANFDILPEFIQPADNELSTLSSGVYHYSCCGKLSCIDRPSDEMDLFSYGSNSYERMAWHLEYLEAYLGEEIFRAAMRRYFQVWQQRHPQPADLRSIFESECQKDLSWFFDGLLRQNKRFDFQIEDLNIEEGKVKVDVTNLTDFDIPYSVSAYNDDDVLQKDMWVEAGTTSVTLPLGDYRRVSVNGQIPFLDNDRTNNHIYPQRLFPKARPLRFGLLANNADSRHQMLSFVPFPTFNAYDGLTLNGLIYSDFFPYRKWRAFVQPGIGIRSGALSGRFGVERDLFLNDTRTRKLTLGLSGRRYSYLGNNISEASNAYTKLTPSVQLHLGTDVFASKYLEYKLHLIRRLDPLDDVAGTLNERIHQFSFRSTGNTRLGKRSLLLQAEYENYKVFSQQKRYLKLTLDHTRQIHYTKDAKFFVRVYGGYFPINTERDRASFAAAFSKGSIALTQQAYTDHTYEGYYLGRSEQEGIYSAQFSGEEGGFKLPLSSRFPTVGNSNDWGVTLNLKADLPIDFFRRIGLRPWLDAGLLSTKSLSSSPLETQLYFAGGVALELGEYAGIYLPLFYSSQFDVPFGSKNILDRISFKIDIQKLNLWRMSEGLEFAF